MTDMEVNTAHAEAVSPLGLDRILPAIAAAMKAVTKIHKDEDNKEQGYAFASIDAFLEMANPICAENGLIVLMEERDVQIVPKKGRYGDQDWLRFHYEITLAHVSGQSLKPTTRQVEVLRSGAQAFGSAQSYVLKQYLRALFMIATGDSDDPDFGNAQTDQREPQRDRSERSERREAQPKRNQQANIEEMVAALSDAKTGKDLLAVCQRIPGAVHAVPEVAEARIEALRMLVKGAQAVAALERFKESFKPDWRHVEQDAESRRAELELELAEKRKAEAEEALRQKREEARQQSKEQASSYDTTDERDEGGNSDLGDDDIPY